MLESFTPPNRRLTFALLIVGGGLVVAAAIVGIPDNPPGLLLVYLGCVAGVTAFVHPWRKPRKYRYLAYVSILALLLLAVLHNVFEALGGQGAGGLSRYGLQPLGVAAFLVAIFVCPAGFVVGMVGALIVFLRNRRGPSTSAPG